jgi:DNA-binding transcriptional LysR family regulator
MTIDRLSAMEAFVRVIEAVSFSRAATQLRVGQPAVSKTIAQLDRLGVRLLLRSMHGLTPTEAGRNFYVRAKRSIEEAEEAELAARGRRDFIGTAADLRGRDIRSYACCAAAVAISGDSPGPRHRYRDAGWR